MINGVEVQVKEKATVYTITSLSEELKSLIRINLASICHGKEKVYRKGKQYSYERTLTEFLARYDTKTPKIKVGMIGELLSHILILTYCENLQSVSPFFNMEEKSIKKGFDIILVDDSASNKLWITEVKSGRLGKIASSNMKNKLLLGKAKEDLKARLNESESQLWHNAINGAMMCMKNSDLKTEIINILEDSLEDTYDQVSNSIEKNVILTSVLFNEVSDKIDIRNVYKFCNETHNDNIFNDLMVISIQKNTLEKMVSFLKSEVGQ